MNNLFLSKEIDENSYNVLYKKLIKLYDLDNKDNLINMMYDNIYNIIEYLIKIINNKEIKEKYNLYYCIREGKKNNNINLLSLYQHIVLYLINNISDRKLKEVDELKSPSTNIIYNLLICDTKIKRKLFLLYVVMYYIESMICFSIYSDENINNKMYVGIDYEFNNRKIALMQINYERLSSKTTSTSSHIFIINPGEFDKKESDILIKYLMRCRYLDKILHGCDSLDLPYMYDILFNSDKEIIQDFTSTVYDTRFFCEYYKNTVNEEKKCSIYDALKYFDVINQNKYDELNNTHDYMGPVQDIDWNIYKMSSHHKKYALYDVLFLKHFLLNIYKKSYNEVPKYFKSYLLIPSLTRLIFMEKKEITNIIKNSKLEIDPIHNYLIKYNNKNYTLIKIYNDIIQNFELKEWELKLENILLINYFRSGLIIIIKKILYYLIIKNYNVYINKTNKMDTNLNINDLFDNIKNTKEYMSLYPFIMELYNKIELKLKSIF